MTDPRIDKIARELAQVIADRADELRKSNPEPRSGFSVRDRIAVRREPDLASDPTGNRLADLERFADIERDTRHTAERLGVLERSTRELDKWIGRVAALGEESDERLTSLEARVSELEHTTSRLLGTLAGRVDELDARLAPVERAFAIIPDDDERSD